MGEEWGRTVEGKEVKWLVGEWNGVKGRGTKWLARELELKSVEWHRD